MENVVNLVSITFEFLIVPYFYTYWFWFIRSMSLTPDQIYFFGISSQVPAATNALASGTEMTTDAQGSRVVLTADGSEPDRLSDLVHQVAYLNTREFPSPGKRIVQLATTLHCKYVYYINTV